MAKWRGNEQLISEIGIRCWHRVVMMEGGSSGSAVLMGLLMGLLITSPTRTPPNTHTQLTGKVNEGKITHWAKKAPQKVTSQKSTGGLLKVTMHIMTELKQVRFWAPSTPTLSDTPDCLLAPDSRLRMWTEAGS